MHLCGLAFLNSEPGSEAQDSGQRRGRAPAPEKAKFAEFSSPPSVGGGLNLNSSSSGCARLGSGVISERPIATAVAREKFASHRF